MTNASGLVTFGDQAVYFGYVKSSVSILEIKQGEISCSCDACVALHDRRQSREVMQASQLRDTLELQQIQIAEHREHQCPSDEQRPGEADDRAIRIALFLCPKAKGPPFVFVVKHNQLTSVRLQPRLTEILGPLTRRAIRIRRYRTRR